MLSTVNPLQLLRRLVRTISNALEQNKDVIIVTYYIEAPEPRLVGAKLTEVVIDTTLDLDSEELFGDDYYLEEEL